MDLESVRQKSIHAARFLGFTVSQSLPLLDDVHITKEADEIFNRLLCLHAVAACAYGFDRKKARAWLEKEGVYVELTGMERQFIDEGVGDEIGFKFHIEGMWALAWAIGLVANLEFDKGCSSEFVMLLPNLKMGEIGNALRSKIKLRGNNELVMACDLAYCLHWVIRQAQLVDDEVPGKLQLYIVEERRRALEWILGDCLWNEVSLDT